MMKKLLILTVILLAGLAGNCSCDEYKCPAPYDLTSETSRFFSGVTGQNFLAEKIAGKLIKKAVQKNLTSGDVSADLKSYSVRDLKAGRFKSIEIKGKNLVGQGIYVSSMEAKTLCDFNYIVENKKGDLTVKEDMPMSVKLVITESDVDKTMASSGYQSMINEINKSWGGEIFRIDSTKVKFQNGKMYFQLKYSLPFARKTAEVVSVSSLSVVNGKIALSDTKLLDGNRNLSKLLSLLNYINPLDFSAKILENKDANFKLKNVKTLDGRVEVDGVIIVLKDKD